MTVYREYCMLPEIDIIIPTIKKFEDVEEMIFEIKNNTPVSSLVL